MRSTRPQRLTKPFEAYNLDLAATTSIVTEATKIPTQRGRNDFLVNCWVETLCTAEARANCLYRNSMGGLALSDPLRNKFKTLSRNE